jgi:uncharacterized membrane protein (UPF0136 family)
MELQTTAMIVLVYGALVVLGGVMGFAKAKSKPSLYAGLGFGFALVISGEMLRQGNTRVLPGATVLAAVLLLVMGIRFARTKKFMPAGLVALMSLAVVIVLVQAIRAHRG